MPRLLLLALLLAIGLCASCKTKPAPAPPAAPPPPAPVSYTDEVRPVLAAKCLHCHGSFAAGNKSGIRLDTVEHATTVRPASGAAPIVPRDPASSSLLQKLFIASPDHNQQTDPDHTVTKEEHSLLTNWIFHGAPYEPHRAFQPLPAEVPLPTTDSTWPRSPIDHFTLKKLAAEAPTPPSTPLRWLQRTALDLTGAPPTPAILAEFQQALLLPDNEGKAMWKATDQLLSSPGFGEHIATRWLQRARYSDFLTPDRRNGQAPYRDWVIDAFNRNLPYNQFLTEQLAGDLFPNPTRDQQLATAFLRLHPLDPDSTSPRKDSTALRTETFARAMLGLDLRCAKCHEHPSEPLTTDDYNSLLAFFESPGDTGLLSPVAVIPAPTLLLPTRPQTEQLLIATQREANTSNEIARIMAAGEPAFTAWIANPDKLPLISDLLGAFSFDNKNGRSQNQALGHTGYAIHLSLPSTTGIRGKAIKLDGATSVPVLDLPPFTRSTPRTFSFWLQMPSVPNEQITLLSHRETSGRGFKLRLEAGHLSARLVREWPGNALGIRSADAVFTPGTWHQITCSYDASSTANGLRLYLDGRLLSTTTTADHIWKELFPNEDSLLNAPTPAADSLIESFPIEKPILGFYAHPALKDSLLDDFQIFSRALTPLEIANLFDGRSLAAATKTGDPNQLRSYYFSSIHPETRKLQQTLASLRQAVVAAETPLTEVSIFRELPLDPLDLPEGHPATKRGLPNFLPPHLRPIDSPQKIHPDRLTLSTWLTRTDNPLTARVFVNHLWANFFNKGIVASTENLGLGSAPNSNPALLDWLARDFINHGWDTKRLCRQITLSATYRQSSSQPLDPIRIRDRALAAADLPGSATEAGDISRSLYSSWLLPQAPDAPSLCPSSPTAPSPLPAPAPLIPAERLEVSKLLATQALQLESNTDTTRLAHFFRTLMGRSPSTDELATLGNTLREQKALLPKDDKTGENPELPLWINTCEAFLNSPAAALK